MTETDPLPGFPAREPAAPVIEHQPAAPPRPARRGGIGGTLLTLFLFVLLAGGLYYVWTNPKGQEEDAGLGTLQRQVQAQEQAVGQHTAQLQAMTQQLQTMGDRMDKLEKAGGTPSAAPAAPETGDLAQKVDDLSAKVAALASQPAAAPAAPADLGDLPHRVDELSAKVAALASQPAPAAPADTGAEQQALAALGARVQQIEAADRTALGQLQAQQKDALDQSQAAVLAEQKSAIAALEARLGKLEQGAGQVEDAASRATRLERVQAAVVALQAGQKLGAIPGAPPELARFANQAPPTEAALRESFPALAQHAREVSQPDTRHESFLKRALARLQQSVTVRQGDDVLVGDPAAGVLSDAQVRVQDGDLAGAVQRLGALRGPAAAAMAGWVDQARSLVAARVALAALAGRG